MSARSAVIIGMVVLLAAGLHAAIAMYLSQPSLPPLHTGRVVGDITYRIDANTTGKYQEDGCRVELYDTLILVYID